MQSSIKSIGYVKNLLKFAFNNNPLLYLSLGISVSSTFIELLAMSSILPLFNIASGAKPNLDGLLSKLFITLNVNVTAETLLWSFVILLLIRTISQIAGQLLCVYFGRQIMAQLTSAAFKNIICRISIGEINKKKIGYFINIAGDEANRASMLIIAITQFSSTVVLGVLYFYAIALYSDLTAMLILAFMLVCSFFLIYVARASHWLGGVQVDQSRLHNTLFMDCMNSLKSIRAFSAENYVTDIHKDVIFRYAKSMFKLDALALFTRMIPVLILLTLFSVWMLVDADPYFMSNLPFVVTIIAYLTRFFPIVGQGVSLLIKIASDAKSGVDITSLLNYDTKNFTSSLNKLDTIDRVKFENIRFSHGETNNMMVLNDINLSFVRGRSYALVGKSGAGKSTLIEILLKFYQPIEGEVFVNDIPLNKIAHTELRKKIIFVPQESAIFDDTITNNILMGLRAEKDEIREACKLACVDTDIQDMHHGYETRLQYQGRNLSGGQRQRIAIARALLRLPDVLILDESTSALDKATQSAVIDNIINKYREKIVLFVTHDPLIINQVDEVIDLGSINI